MKLPFKEPIDRLAAQFDARPERERALLAVAIIGGAAFVGYTLLLEPAQQQLKNEQQRISRQDNERNVANATFGALRQKLAADPDAGAKERLARLQKELQASSERLQAMQNRLVPPERMRELLARMLARHGELRLLTLKSLPPSNLARTASSEAAQNGKPDSGSNIYRHGIEIKLEGSYSALYAWLKDMEALQEGPIWGEMLFSAGPDGQHTLAATLFTLGLDQAWIAI